MEDHLGSFGSNLSLEYCMFNRSIPAQVQLPRLATEDDLSDEKEGSNSISNIKYTRYVFN